MHPNLVHVLVLTAAVLACAAALWTQRESISAGKRVSLDASTLIPFRVCTPHIERSELENSTSPPLSRARLNTLARSLRKETHPRVFRGGFSNFGWRAFDVWSAAYFVEAAESGVGPPEMLIKRADQRVFRFANLRAPRPYSRANATETLNEGSVSWPQLPLFSVPFTSQNLSTRNFFTELQTSNSKSPREFVYFSDGLSVLGHLARDLMPIQPLCPFTNADDRCDCSLWIGAADVTAYPHYDASHNLYVQIRGKKRFTLAAPSAARCGLGLYPSLHPYYRQTQRDLLDGDVASFPVIVPTASLTVDGTCCTTQLYDVVLDAGDALFIPPGWFHRVTALSPDISFSVNSWWESKDYRTMAKIGELPLPFQEEWSARLMVFATALYVRLLYEEMEAHLRHVVHADTPITGSFLAAELLATRYIPLFEGHHLDAEWCAEMRQNLSRSSRSDESGIGACTHLTQEELQQMLPNAPSPDSDASPLEALRKQFLPYAQRVLSLYRQVPPELARLHLQNMVEEIVFFVLEGKREQLYPFLACCVDRT